MKIDFYNLEKRPFDASICQILQKAYISNEFIVVKVKDKDNQDAMDKLLWEFDAKSWLPHSTSDGQDQPIFITTDLNKENNATILMITDGSEIPTETKYARCLYVFNGNDKEMLDKARAQYKLFLDKKFELQYHNL